MFLSNVVSDGYVTIDGYYNGGVWRYSDGTEITYMTRWRDLLFSVSILSVITLFNDKKNMGVDLRN